MSDWVDGDWPKQVGRYRVRVESGKEFDAEIVAIDHEIDTWAAVNECDAPDSWTDGYWWVENDNLEMSEKVVAYKRIEQ